MTAHPAHFHEDGMTYATAVSYIKTHIGRALEEGGAVPLSTTPFYTAILLWMVTFGHYAQVGARVRHLPHHATVWLLTVVCSLRHQACKELPYLSTLIQSADKKAAASSRVPSTPAPAAASTTKSSHKSADQGGTITGENKENVKPGGRAVGSGGKGRFHISSITYEMRVALIQYGGFVVTLAAVLCWGCVLKQCSHTLPLSSSLCAFGVACDQPSIMTSSRRRGKPALRIAPRRSPITSRK